MSHLIAWNNLTRLGPFRWGDLALWRAARVAVGVVVPLALGWGSGHVSYGAYAALGALPAGFAAFQGETRSRLTAVVVTSLGMAVSTFVGAVTAAAASWLLVPVVAIWGYFTGLAVCLSPQVSVAVLQWSIALLVAVGLPFGPAQAALRAGLVLAGGLFQAVLVAASWTLRPGSRERMALAASYRALADYATGLAAGRSGPPPPTAFPAGSKLDDPNPLLSVAQRLVLLNLLEEAERIRASLAALAQIREDSPGSANQIHGLIADAADALNLIAGALSAERAQRAALVRDLGETVNRLNIASGVSWRWAGEALLGQLRAVARIAADFEGVAVGAVAGTAGTTRSLAHSPSGAAATIAMLRANGGATSEAGRHALRLAVIATLAEVMVQGTGLYQGRWVTLTIFIVLKPDYASTLYRGVQRAAGTMVGAGLGVAAGLTHAGQAGLVAAASASIAVAYALFDVSYLLFSVFLTTFVMVLLDLLGLPAIATAQARLLDTVIGAVMALTAYFAWPTWHGATAREKFAQHLEAHRVYAAALLRELAHPGTVGAAQLRAVQLAARRARSDAEAATARLQDEPAHPPLTPGVARLIIATVARFAHAELALHALVLSPPRPAASAGAGGDVAGRLDAFSTALDAALSRFVAALTNLQAPQTGPAVRPLQAALAEEPALRDTPAVAITDRLVDAANTLQAVLSERLLPISNST
jgi:uncharacterized membrane protein YccC